ncbi:MAG: hypothetical protein IKM59_04005, partial [Oscillospiraceae bacterium]|nr:hypothetical protein [Oscillospiraceae bacterium]
MAENKKKDPFQYDFDEQWDVERELYGRLWGNTGKDKAESDDTDVLLSAVNDHSAGRSRRETVARSEESRQESPEREKKTVPPVAVAYTGRPEERERKPSAKDKPGGTRMPPQPRKRPPAQGKKKGKPNYKGWAILIAMALAAILVLYFLIQLFVWVLSPGEGGKEEEIPETSTTETVPTTTVDYEAIAAELLEQAELQAAMYDYDGAMETVKSFGSGWSQRGDLNEAVQRYEQLKLQTVRWEDT